MTVWRRLGRHRDGRHYKGERVTAGTRREAPAHAPPARDTRSPANADQSALPRTAFTTGSQRARSSAVDWANAAGVNNVRCRGHRVAMSAVLPGAAGTMSRIVVTGYVSGNAQSDVAATSTPAMPAWRHRRSLVEIGRMGLFCHGAIIAPCFSASRCATHWFHQFLRSD